MQEISIKRASVILLLLLFIRQISFGQTDSCEKVDKELATIYPKIKPFFYDNQDSLAYYSDLFTNKLTSYVKNNPSSLNCKFPALTDSKACGIITTSDGKFRVYSWNTWQGGTMNQYKNIFQYSSDGKVYTPDFDYGEGDMGTYFSDVYYLKANNKIYLLAITDGNESSSIAYECIRVYSIEGNRLNDKVPLIKTPKGLQNSITIEYSIFSAGDRKLIKYDSDKKIIYIPIVLENGNVTDRNILYQFKGECFEHLLTEKKSSGEK